MQLTPPQAPQSDDLDALRAGLSGYNLAMAGSHQREQIASFQALPFYQKQGYSVFGELPDMPPGHVSYFLKKQGSQ